MLKSLIQGATDTPAEQIERNLNSLNSMVSYLLFILSRHVVASGGTTPVFCHKAVFQLAQC
jgi:hypothetical protein